MEKQTLGHHSSYILLRAMVGPFVNPPYWKENNDVRNVTSALVD